MFHYDQTVTMKTLVHVMALSLFYGASSVADEPSLVENPTVHFRSGDSSTPLADSLVCVQASGQYSWRPLITDSEGQVTDRRSTVYPPKPGTVTGRTYLVFPQEPGRWSLLKATTQALPSSDGVLDGPDNSTRSSFLEKIAVQVASKWDEIDGRTCIRTEPAPLPGLIRMQALSASGEPLRNHPVQLIARDLGFGFASRETAVWSGSTDDAGVIHIRQFPGMRSWIVAFPGLGHSQSGPLIIDPGSVTDVELNRPVRYATISGQVDRKLLDSLTPESRIYLDTRQAWRYREAEVNSEGQFQIADVPIGANYDLKITGISTKHCYVRGLGPGELRKGVQVNLSEQSEAELAELNKQSAHQQASRRDWKPTLRGRVIDVSGNTVPDVTVFATMKFHGGRRMYQTTKEATTDENGQYEIADAEFRFGSVALMAYVPGRPLAFGAGGYFGPSEVTSVLAGAGGATFGSEPAGPLPDVLEQPDLVLPDPEQGGQLQVTTLLAGAPREGVNVRLELVDFHSSFSPGWAAGGTPESLNRVLTPQVVTDSSGRALFTDLCPGQYRVTASLPKREEADDSPYNNHWSSHGVTTADRVAVISGGSDKISLFVDDTDETNIPFNVQHTDGTRLTKTSVSTSWTDAGTGSGWNSGSKVDEDGVGAICPGQTGMWRLFVRYLTPLLGTNVVPQRTLPCYSDEKLVAVSRLTSREGLLEFAAREVRPATIVVTVEDQDGQRAQGTVSLNVGRHDDGFKGHESRFASTDIEGNVCFTRVQTGAHKLQATIPGLSAATARLDAPDSEFASEYDVPSRVINVVAGEDREVELRARQMSYIRGKITPPPNEGERVDFRIENNWLLLPVETQCLHSNESGEFIVGPVLRGKHTVAILEFDKQREVSSFRYEFDVTQPGVHREDIPYAPTPTNPARQATQLVRGVVYRADGKTPVYAARVAVYAPGSALSDAAAWTDARGRFELSSRIQRMGLSNRFAGPNGPPDQAALVAWLPGELGATVVPLPSEADTKAEDIHLVLPEQTRIHGTVTLNGASTLGLPASIRVFAQHLGSGNLDKVFSVLVAANADGSYELRGLTPGTYEIQAAVDGIWVSRTQAVVVEGDSGWTNEVNFDVPPIGDIAQYQIVDESGKPVSNTAVRLLSPEFSGPLAKALRTDEVTTDAKGLLYLEGLAAGEHSFILDGSKSEFTVTVPQLGSPMVLAEQIKVVD